MSERIEYCCKCDEATGRAGRGDDSIYLDDDSGPYCVGCYKDAAIEYSETEITRLRAENAAKDARIAELESVMATRDFAQSSALALYKEKVAELEAALYCENSPYEAKTHRCVHCDEEVLR